MKKRPLSLSILVISSLLLLSFVLAQTEPIIDYVPPTPDNATTQPEDYIYVNVSSSDDNLTYGFTNFDNSLVGWWRLDNDTAVGENNTHVYDWSGKGNNGTNVDGNATSTTTGKFGGGFEFDGDGDYININDADSLDVTDYFSLSMWFYLNETINASNDYSSLFYKKYAYGLWWQGADDGLMRFGTFGDNIVSNKNSWEKGGWFHVVAVHDGNTSYIYVNGTLDNSSVNTDPVTKETDDMWLGYHNFAGNWYFNGTIDEVLIFNRSLSADEVQTLYNATKQFYNNYTNLSESKHTFQSFVVDEAGNKNETELREVNISFSAGDTTPPTIAIQSPTNTTHSTGDLDYNITVSEVLSMAVVSIDGGANMSMGNDSATHYYNLSGNHPTLSDGLHNATFWVNDTAGNGNQTTVYFTVNTTVPTQLGQSVQFILTLDDNTSTVYIPGVGSMSAGSLSNATYTNPPHYFLSSELNSMVRGLVFQERTAVSLITNRTGSVSHTLRVNQELTNSKAFLVFTTGSFTNILNRISLIEQGNFLNYIDPTFGFTLGNVFPIKFILNTTAFDLQGNLIIHGGAPNVLVHNTGDVVDGKIVITISLA